jgi:AAA domain
MSSGNGVDHTALQERPYVSINVLELLEPGIAPEYVVDQIIPEASVVGLVAPPEAGKSLLMQEMGLCVALGIPFHGRPTKRGLVMYLAGEGQHGLDARFQALHSRYETEMCEKVIPMEFGTAQAQLLDPMETLRVKSTIYAAEETHDLELSLLIVDTLSRFIAPGDESKAQDMGAYLNAIDMLRGSAAVVSLHHPGHGDATRGRGSSSFKAGLDAEFAMANADGIITVSCQKMKDGAKPAPFSFKIEQAPTKMVRADGTPLMSVLLHSTETVIIRKKPTGKHQKALLSHLESIKEGARVWQEEELRELGRGIGMNRFQARDAVLGLRQLGYFTWTAGGSRLSCEVVG